MNKKLLFTIIFVFATVLGITVGYSVWGINSGNNDSVSNIEDIQSYDTFNVQQYLNLNSNASYHEEMDNINCLKYYDTGFLNAESTEISDKAYIRCYYSITPNRLNIDSNFSIILNLENVGATDYLSYFTYSTSLVKQTTNSSVILDDGDGSNNNLSITYSDIAHNLPTIYFYVEYEFTLKSPHTFSTLKNNLNNMSFRLNISINSSALSGKWMINRSEIMVPQYDPLPYIASKLNNLSRNYNGSAIKPYMVLLGNSEELNECLASDFQTKVNSNTFSFKYRPKADISSNPTFTNGFATNAGTYTYRIFYNGDYKEFDYTINGTKIYANYNNTPLSLTYSETLADAITSWGSGFSNKVKSMLSFVDENNNQIEIPSGDYSIRLFDGTFSYYYSNNEYLRDFSNANGVAKGYTEVAGSTYIVNIIMLNGGYSYEGTISGNLIMLKYKTAWYRSNYYTIEEAINDSNTSDITLEGNKSDTSYVITAFSKWAEVNNYYWSGTKNITKKIIVPQTSKQTLSYNSDNDNKNVNGHTDISSTEVGTQMPASCLYIPNNVNVNIKNGIYICGSISQWGKTLDHGVIYIDGNMYIDNGAVMHSYGFVKGSGMITMKSGSIVYDEMRFLDCGGASDALSVYSNGAFPFSTWIVNNISCKLKIMSGSTLYAHSTLYGTYAGYNRIDATIFGNGSNVLFKPSSDNPSNYVLKYGVDNSNSSNTNNGGNNSITEDNQKATNNKIFAFKIKVELHGKYSDATFAVTLQGTNVSTSATKCVPISNMDIIIYDSSSVTISHSSFLFLRGTKMIIEKNATLSIDGGIYLAFDKSNGSASTICTWFDSYCGIKQDAYIENNGIISINNGKIGGIIKCAEAGAAIADSSKLQIASGTIKKKTNNSTVSSYEADYDVFGNKTSTSISNVTLYNPSSYIYESKTENPSIYYWDVSNQNISTYTIKFYEGSTLLEEKVMTNFDSTYQITGSEFRYEKEHYNWLGWNTAQSGIGDYVESVETYISNGGSKNLYAQWEESIYSIEYYIFVNGSLVTDGYGIENNGTLITTYTYSDLINGSQKIDLPSIVYPTSGTPYYFDGWYLEIENVYSRKIDAALTKNMFDSIYETLSNYGVNMSEYSLPLVCNLYDLQQLTINFDKNTSESGYSNPPSETGIANFSFYLPTSVGADNDTKQHYLSGWSFGGNTYSLGQKINVTVSNSKYFVDGIDLGYSVSTTFTAVWDDKMELIFNYQGKASNTSKWYKIGDSINLPSNPSEVTVDGVIYKLKHWSMTSNGGAYSGNMTNDLFQLYAIWDRSYKLTLVKNNGSSDEVFNMLSGEVKTLPTDYLKDYYNFDAWYGTASDATNNSGTKYSSFTMGTSDTTLYAGWIPKTYNIIQGNHTNGATLTVATSAQYGSTVTYTPKDGDGITSVTFSVDDGETISSNTSVTSGTSYTFTMPHGNVTITVNGKAASCLLPGTLVTMADGSTKEIRHLVSGDMVMVFNHETGKLDIAPVTFNEYEIEQWFNVIHLVFDNGANIGVISEHGFFDLDTMKYEYIVESNYQDFIGHRFYTIDGTPTTLIDAYVEEEYTMCYSLPTYYHLNLFTEDILSMPGGIKGLFNIFEYSETLQYDQELMEQDINTYGLFTIEELEPLGVTEEMFNAYAGKYLKVALGKGILTEEYLMYLIERYGKYTE